MAMGVQKWVGSPFNLFSQGNGLLWNGCTQREGCRYFNPASGVGLSHPRALHSMPESGCADEGRQTSKAEERERKTKSNRRACCFQSWSHCPCECHLTCFTKASRCRVDRSLSIRSLAISYDHGWYHLLSLLGDFERSTCSCMWPHHMCHMFTPKHQLQCRKSLLPMLY